MKGIIDRKCPKCKKVGLRFYTTRGGVWCICAAAFLNNSCEYGQYVDKKILPDRERMLFFDGIPQYREGLVIYKGMELEQPKSFERYKLQNGIIN